MSINYTENKDNIVVISQGDKEWFFSPDNLRLVPRASVIISTECPREYKMMIQHAIENGWIKLNSYMKEKYFVWEKLGG